MSVDNKIKEIKDCLGELIAEMIKPSTTVGSRVHHAHYWYNQIEAILYDISAKVHGDSKEQSSC